MRSSVSLPVVLEQQIVGLRRGALPRTSWKCPLLLISDNALLVARVLGRCKLPSDPGKTLAVKRLGWLVYLLGFRLPFKPDLPAEDLLVHRKRDAELLPNTVCSLILKEKSDYFWVAPEFCSIPEGAALHVYFGGGFESGEGVYATASCAAVVQLCSPEGTVIVGAAGRVLHCEDAEEALLEGALCACEFIVEVCKRTNLWAK